MPPPENEAPAAATAQFTTTQWSVVLAARHTASPGANVALAKR